MNLDSHHHYDRRSPLAQQFSDAQYRLVAGQQQPWTLSTSADYAALFDLTLMPRFGVRGAGAAAYLQSRDIDVPSMVNTASVSPDARWVARLGKTEYWVFYAALCDAYPPHMLGLDSIAEGCYPVPCDQARAWFVIDHAQRAAAMAKLCAVDLRDDAFPSGHVAQTSVARVNATVISHTIAERAVFSIFSDVASAQYLWGALEDALDEYGAGAGALGTLLGAPR
ncbi:MAG: sarcosine oxidase [Pseudomonadota bacterium]